MSSESRVKSLTSQRGDGIKARHIPELLKFISGNDGFGFHIWGFEEPENSLDFVAMEAEAERFVKLGSEDRIQIFVTTHSPSFYNLKRGGVQKFYVRLDEKGTSSVCQGKELEKVDALDAMGEGFYLPAVAASLQELSAKQEEIRRYQAELVRLQEEIAADKIPTLVTEGRTDVDIIIPASL